MGHVEYREYQPAPDLCPFVDRYWMLTGEALAADAILPDGHTKLIAHLDTPPSHRGRRRAYG
jgi:hypothetical protein